MRLPFLLFTLAASSAAAQLQSTTLVDALSADKDYEALLLLLQRARLIPTLNKLRGSTFFAPTNDAIKQHSQSSPLWSYILNNDDFLVTDNIQEQLRQQLFYHLLNYSIAEHPAAESTLRTFETLHYPHKPLDPPSRQPPPHPPWMPIPSGTLGKKSQRLRAVLSDQNQKGRVGVDAFGQGGADIVKGMVDAGNGVLLGISEVLDPPPDLGNCSSLCL